MAEKKDVKNADMLNELYKQYGLVKKDHIFVHPANHYTIITRAGIDKIQAEANISIDYEVMESFCSQDHTTFLIKATGTMGDVSLTTFGEVTPKNNINKYPVAMAEKRAMSRVVLKLAGLYAYNVFGEDEATQFGSEVTSAKKAEALTPVIKS